MVAVAVAWSFTGPLDKLAVAQAGVMLHAVIQVTILSIATAGWMVVRAGRAQVMAQFQVPAAARWLMVGAAVTASMAYAFQLTAYQITMVAFVETLKRVVEIGAALVVGMIFFRERLSLPKIIGGTLIAVGVPLMVVPSIG